LFLSVLTCAKLYHNVQVCQGLPASPTGRIRAAGDLAYHQAPAAVPAPNAAIGAGGVLPILQTTPIDPVALDANLTLLATARAIPDPPAADIAALATFLPLPSPTAAQTATATKALIRGLANYADVAPAQRATINVLADTIRFMLQR
jgi:hypothetical protein